MFNSVQPLHKTTHFRRLRDVITALAKKAKLNISKYNLMNMRCYRCRGKNLHGKNVVTLNAISKSRSCFVKENDYEIYECPSTTNKEDYVGNFLVVAHNTTFDYWMLILMNHSISIKNNKAYVNVVYDPKINCFVNYKGPGKVETQLHTLGETKTWFLHPGHDDKDSYFDVFITNSLHAILLWMNIICCTSSIKNIKITVFIIMSWM